MRCGGGPPCEATSDRRMSKRTLRLIQTMSALPPNGSARLCGARVGSANAPNTLKIGLSSPTYLISSTPKLGTFMLDTRTRVVAESVFDRNKRREAEIIEVLKQEEARREAAVKNMLRLRALRLARHAKLKKQ